VSSKKINMWLDDVRPAPEGWKHDYSVYEAIDLIKKGHVENASLDHDLGENKPTGYKLCMRMAEFNKWPKNKPAVHSMNPVGAFAMRAIIERYGPWDV